MEVVALIGPRGSGKDFSAMEYLKKGYVQIGMADLVREIVWAQIGWAPKDLLEYENFKTMVFNNALIENYFNYFTGRDLLNGLTNKIIEVNPDFWFEGWFKKVEKALAEGKSVVLTDMRYYSSAKFLQRVIFRGADYRVVFCNYKSEKYGLQEGVTEQMIADVLKEYGGNIEHLTDITEFFKKRSFESEY